MPDPRFAAPTALIGREAEMRLVEGLLEGSDPDSSALVLTGDPGVGKTAILRAAAAAGSAQGFRILMVQGVEFEAELSYAALHQLVLGIESDTARLTGAQRSALNAAMGLDGAASPGGLALSAAVIALLQAAATDRPVLLLIDDFQWLDRASAHVFAFVARRAASLPLRWLATVRIDTDDLLANAGLPTHHLQPLPRDSALQVLDSHHPGLDGRVQQRLLKDAEGNPLALIELASALLSERHADGGALPSLLPLNERLKATFGSRFTKLPQQTRRIALQAALAGSQTLSALGLGFHVDRDLAALESAERERLVRVDRARMRVTFSHPLVRAAVVEMSSAAEVREAHLSLAKIANIDPDRRTWHLAAAAVQPDEAIAASLEQTSLRNLQRGDTSNAIETMLRAAELSQDEHLRNTRLLRAAHLAVNITGQLDELERLMADVRPEDGPDEALYAAATAAISSISQGHCDVPAACRMLCEVIRTHAGTYQASNAALMAAIGALGTVASLVGRSEAWQAYLSAVDRLEPRAPRDTYLFRTCFADPARADAQAMGELHAAVDDLSRGTEQWPVVKVATASIYVDALEGCIEPLLRLVAPDDGQDIAVLAGPAITCLGAHAFATGAWDEAQRWHQRAIDLSAGRGIELTLYPHHYRLGKVAALRGDTRKAEECVEVVTRWATSRRAFGAFSAVRHVQALLAMTAGDYEAAYTAASAVSPPGQFALCEPHAIELSLELVEACVHTGRRAEAKAHVKEMRRLNIARLSSRCALRVAGCMAIAAAPAEATALYEVALATPDSAGWPYETARIRLAYGQHLRRTKGSVADARRQLTEALETFDRMGAKPWCARASTELRALGTTRTHRSGVGPAALTPQEREIALLAATGLTNKEIGARVYLSARTVGAHLYHAYPKLGIASRAALRDALSQLDDE